MVAQAIPQIAELLRRYDRRMAEEAKEREAEKESAA